MRDERWSAFSREAIAARGDSLDLGLIRDAALVDATELPDPVESGEECLALLDEAMDLMRGVVRELQRLTGKEAE